MLPDLISILHIAFYLVPLLITIISINIIRQLLFHKQNEPPLIFHWIPFVGNAIGYGTDPYKFLLRCREKHGDIFTFVLLGRKMTCYLGLAGNEFILNGKHSHLNAEEIYSPLTTPVFGADVVYDCPNAKLMEQKKFIKFGLTQDSLERYVPLIEREVLDYISVAPAMNGDQGEVGITGTMAEITIFTAGRALQGEEVRKKLTNEMAQMYHDLDLGFQPINFLLPWAPLPHNRRRDIAHAKMSAIYTDIIDQRRRLGLKEVEQGSDMIWNLMRCVYKDGRPVPDKEIANMMITLLMAGQHSSASAGSWTMLRLASRPDIAEELYDEQLRTLGRNGRLPPLQYTDLDKLPLLQGVIKETLRVHSSITSILRKVTQPLPVSGTPYVVTPDKVLLASPVVTAKDNVYFPNGATWDPHRWLARDDDDDNSNKEDIVDYGYGATLKGTKSPYLPFGAGRHRCIGEKFAYINLGVIVATLVRNFKFSTVDGTDSVPETDYASLFSGPKKPAIICWERRYGQKKW